MLEASITRSCLTVTFGVVNVVSFFSFTSVFVVLRFWGETVRVLGFRSVMVLTLMLRGGCEARTVGRTRCQRLSVTQNVLDQKRGGGGPRGARGWILGHRMIMMMMEMMMKAVLHRMRFRGIRSD